MVPGWIKAGYKKSTTCDRCKFQFKNIQQAKVYYLDGNKDNNHWANLRTICLNCELEIKNSGWVPCAISADF